MTAKVIRIDFTKDRREKVDLRYPLKRSIEQQKPFDGPEAA